MAGKRELRKISVDGVLGFGLSRKLKCRHLSSATAAQNALPVTRHRRRVWDNFEVWTCQEYNAASNRNSETRIQVGDKQLHVSPNHQKHEGMKIAFIGTAAERSRSCFLLKLGGSNFMFNCGENSIRHLLQAPYLKQRCSVFVTIKLEWTCNTLTVHLQIIGIPAYLCDGIPDNPLTIYGPQGLRNYIRTTLKACFARVPSKYSVHELILSNSLRIAKQESEELLHEDELYGDDLVCSTDGLCQVFKDEKCTITTGVICRETQSWAYFVNEMALDKKETPGQSDAGRGHSVGKAIMGHGSEVESFISAAKGADCLVHVTTSIPELAAGAAAGACAKAINARCLILTGSHGHGMHELVRAAKSSFGKETVVTASDHMCITIGSLSTHILNHQYAIRNCSTATATFFARVINDQQAQRHGAIITAP